MADKDHHEKSGLGQDNHEFLCGHFKSGKSDAQLFACMQGWKEGLQRDVHVVFVTGRMVFELKSGMIFPKCGLDSGISIGWKLVRNAESLTPSQTYRVCILTCPPGDSNVQESSNFAAY